LSFIRNKFKQPTNWPTLIKTLNFCSMWSSAL